MLIRSANDLISSNVTHDHKSAQNNRHIKVKAKHLRRENWSRRLQSENQFHFLIETCWPFCNMQAMLGERRRGRWTKQHSLIDALALLRLSDGPLHPGERGLGARRQVLGRHGQRVLQRRDHPLDDGRVPQRSRARRTGRRVGGRAGVAAAVGTWIQ